MSISISTSYVTPRPASAGWSLGCASVLEFFLTLFCFVTVLG
jgi:hypothetical protein